MFITQLKNKRILKFHVGRRLDIILLNLNIQSSNLCLFVRMSDHNALYIDRFAAKFDLGTL